ncbi:chaplin [Streptomyces sp. NPDC091292]|uniref:chaplin n=1 Tax=Streptomyces sp. NPDC091292 TaxID=3365991 RepID=UPI0037F58061
MRQALSKGMLTAAAATSILSLPGGHAFAADADSAAVGSPGVLSGNSVSAPIEVPVNVCGNTANGASALNPSFGNGCSNGGAPAPHRAQAPRAVPAPEAAPAPAPTPAPVPVQRAAPARHAAPVPERVVPRAESGPYAGPATHTTPARHASPTRHVSQGSSAQGRAEGSPGFLSGNLLGAPVDAPVNACGNTVNVVALLNPVFGNRCGGGVPGPEVAPPGVAVPGEPGVEGPGTTPVVGVVPREAPPVVRAVPPGPVTSGTRMVPPGGVRAGVHQSPVVGASLAETGVDGGVIGAAAASFALLIGGGVLYRRGVVVARR